MVTTRVTSGQRSPKYSFNVAFVERLREVVDDGMLMPSHSLHMRSKPTGPTKRREFFQQRIALLERVRRNVREPRLSFHLELVPRKACGDRCHALCRTTLSKMARNRTVRQSVRQRLATKWAERMVLGQALTGTTINEWNLAQPPDNPRLVQIVR